MVRIAVITGFLGELQDRFCRYNQARTVKQKLELAAETPGVDGVELIYPYDFAEPGLIETALRDLGLGVAAVNVNVKSEPEFTSGSLTSEDRSIRNRAIEFMVRAMDAALAIGCRRVTVCPLSDGCDYPFQMDYRAAWQRMKDAFATAAAHRRDVTVSLEYKPSETRVHCLLSSAYKTLALISDLGIENLGMTLDFGHSLCIGENPSEVLALVRDHGVPIYVHLNDNHRDWDWDLIPGASNPLDLIEFLWTALQYGYDDDWFTLDVFPSRLDPRACFSASASLVRAAMGVARRVGLDEVRSIRACEEGGQVVPRLIKYVWDEIRRPGTGGA